MDKRAAMLRSCLVATALVLPAVVYGQQTYPSRPVRIITPYEPGGSSTIVSRLVGAKLAELWGHSVVIDNRPGGNTTIGTSAGARANPDGYTLTFANTTFALNHLLIRKLPYNSLKDFAPVANIYNNETLLAVHPSVPANTLNEFIAYAKSRPGELNHGSSGVGGLTELRSAMFRLLTGTDFQNIAYKGSGGVATALLGAHVQFGMVPPITVAAYINSGKLRGLAVTGSKRVRALPQVPTFAEAGLAAYNVTSWNGLLMPAATPKAIVDKVSADIAKVLAMPDIHDKLSNQGSEPAYADPEEFAKIIRSDVERFAKVIKEARIPMVD
ncbi:MAG: tripartite tricarboxylate transporter substrate binding protein [Burkholderiales bacterium]|nr:tripartite tricarboxylate transporter substrate binding protein [Burkholderiales bacterium]